MFWSRKSLVKIKNLNDVYFDNLNSLKHFFGEKETKLRMAHKNKIFVLDFNGDVMAFQAKALAYEVSSVISIARPGDEVFIRLMSPGGAVHGYGYASSQIDRLKKAGIPITVSVDKIAASGGYMMSCIADKIIASPYAIVGSIGVVAEFPNFNGLLKNFGVDYKQYTAGKYKRTVSAMGAISEEGEEKFKNDLNDMFELFKSHVSTFRPSVDIEKVATGEHWFGIKAKEMGLVDEIMTSDEYITEHVNKAELIHLSHSAASKSFFESSVSAIVNITMNALVSTFERVLWKIQ